MRVKIVKIHRSKRHGKTIYASLIEDNGRLILLSTIDNIMDVIEIKGYTLID